MVPSRTYHHLVNEIQDQEKTEGISQQSALRDLLTDLRHVAKDYGLNFEEALRGSYEVFQEEKDIPCVSPTPKPHK